MTPDYRTTVASGEKREDGGSFWWCWRACRPGERGPYSRWRGLSGIERGGGLKSRGGDQALCHRAGLGKQCPTRISAVPSTGKCPVRLSLSDLGRNDGPHQEEAYKGHQTKNGFDCQRHASYAPPVYRWSNYGHRCNSKPFAAIRRQCIEALAVLPVGGAAGVSCPASEDEHLRFLTMFGMTPMGRGITEDSPSPRPSPIKRRLNKEVGAAR